MSFLFNMNKVAVFGFLFLLPAWAWGLKLELLGQTTMAHKLKFEKTTVGGLSGIYFDPNSETLFAVSDDRGREGEPRFYEFAFKFQDGKIRVEPQAVRFIKKAERKLNTVLDMEGLAPLPWGNFLISSEGDNNHKPRIPPELLDVKKDGTWVRSFELPAKFIPESSGRQTRGIRNNRGFEGLSRSPPNPIEKTAEKAAEKAAEKIFLMNEESLVQDSADDVGPLRLLAYEMPEAWVIKASKEYLYWPEKGESSANSAISLGGRVSEILALSTERLLVLERTMQLGPQSLNYACKIFDTSLTGASDISGVESLKTAQLDLLKPMKKELVLDFETLKEKLGGAIENFEGLAFGPEVNKKKTLIVISDDNFKKSERTQILLFSISE